MQWNDYLFYSAELNLNIFLVGLNYMFIAIGIIDYKRKLTSSRIVNSLINPVKDKRFPYLQMFPTINLADRRSLYSWLQIRTSLLDFGQKFSLRVQLYSSCFLLIYSIFALKFYYDFFFNIDTLVLYPFYFILLYDTVMALCILLLMIERGAMVNTYFVKDLRVLASLRSTYKFVQINLKKILQPDYYHKGQMMVIIRDHLLNK